MFDRRIRGLGSKLAHEWLIWARVAIPEKTIPETLSEWRSVCLCEARLTWCEACVGLALERSLRPLDHALVWLRRHW